MKTTLHPTFACQLVNTNLPVMLATVRNGKPRQAYVKVRHPVAKIPVDVLPCTYQTEMAKQMDWREKQTPQMARVPEALKGWGAWGITCGFKVHCAIDRLEERGVKRGTARRSSLRGRKNPIVSQSNCGAIPAKETFDKRVGAHMGFSSAQVSSWIELNWSREDRYLCQGISEDKLPSCAKANLQTSNLYISQKNTHSLYYLRQTWILFISYKP